MSENDNTGTDDLERAADEGPLPGVVEADRAEEEGREDSATGSSGADGDGDTPAGGVVMGAVNQH